MQLPIIFVCENNQYSVDTHIAKRQSGWLNNHFAMHNVRKIRKRGHDVFALAGLFEAEIDGLRNGNDPLIVVLETERSHVHCGIDKEFDLKCDPLNAAIKQSKLDDAMMSLRESMIMADINRAFDAAESAPLPTPDMASRYVYA